MSTQAKEKKEKKEFKVSQETICEISRSKTEIVRVSHCTPEEAGKAPYIDVRLHFLHEESGEYLPTKKGFTLKPELVKDFARGLAEAEQFVQAKQ